MLILGERQREFSVFVNNIPEELDQYGLKGIFQKSGRVTKAYIPWRKIRRQRTRFGFVQFCEEEDAIRSTKLFNNANIRGRRLQVDIAKYEKGEKIKRRPALQNKREKPSRQVWRKKDKQDGHEKGMECTPVNKGNHIWEKTLTREINTELEEQLKRSLVCTTEEPKDLATLSSAIIHGYGQCSKI